MRSIRSNILKSEHCYATTALACFLDQFGTEGLDWLPETIFVSMEEAYGALPIGTLNKLMAGIQILTSDDFFTKVGRFVDYTNILNHGHFDDSVADVGEIAWALTEVKIINDPGSTEDPLAIFVSDIVEYIEAAFNNSGLTYPPDIFKYYGLYFPDKRLNVLSSYADNPELYSILDEAVKYHTALVNAAIKQNLDELFIQLSQCGLNVPDVTADRFAMA